MCYTTCLATDGQKIECNLLQHVGAWQVCRHHVQGLEHCIAPAPSKWLLSCTCNLPSLLQLSALNVIHVQSSLFSNPAATCSCSNRIPAIMNACFCRTKYSFALICWFFYVSSSQSHAFCTVIAALPTAGRSRPSCRKGAACGCGTQGCAAVRGNMPGALQRGNECTRLHACSLRYVLQLF